MELKVGFFYALLSAGELNLTISIILLISVSMAVIKDLLTNYMKDLIYQAYMLLKLCNNYFIVLIWIDNQEIHYSFKQKVFFFIYIKQMIFH